MMSGQRAVSFDPTDGFGLYSGVRGLYTGDMAYNMGTLFGSAALSSNNQIIVNFGNGITNQTPYLSVDSSNNLNSSIWGSHLSSNVTPIVNEPFTLEGNHTSGPMSSPRYEIYVDGPRIDSPTITGSGTLNVPSNPHIRLGHQYTVGDMFESWIYNRSAAGDEILDRKESLARKWGKVADNNKAPGGVQKA